MTMKDELLESLREICEAPPTADEQTRLDSLTWDSMSRISVIALMDDQFGMEVSPDKLDACQTLGDLVKLSGGDDA